jgi:exonuclease III
MDFISFQPYTQNSNHSNWLASALDAVGHKLTAPTRMMFEQATKVARPLKVSFQDQCNTEFKEICMRIARVFVCIILALALPLGILGAGLSFLASSAKGEFTFIHPTIDVNGNQKIDKIRIRTFNLGMMPEFIAIRNGLRPTKERIGEAAQELLKADDDVICLQELFQRDAADEIASRLKEKYPYIVYNAGPNNFGLNSGLFIASKYPITHAEFHCNKERGGAEAFAHKGTLAVTVRPHPDQPLFIFNSHLNGGADESERFPQGGRSYRKSQLNQVSELVSRYLAEQTPKGKMPTLFLCGDYNIGPLRPAGEGSEPDPEWSAVTEVMQPFVEDDERGRTTYDMGADPRVGWDKSSVEMWPKEAQYVDHIGIPRSLEENHNVQLLSRQIESMGGCSDHLAVAATFALSEPSGEHLV